MILLALLGYQLPKLLGGGGDADRRTAADDRGRAPPGPDRGLPGGAGGASLPDTDRVTVQAGSGQLLSFGLFKSKDPFVQQLSANTPAVRHDSPALAGAAPARPVAPATTTSAAPGDAAPHRAERRADAGDDGCAGLDRAVPLHAAAGDRAGADHGRAPDHARDHDSGTSDDAASDDARDDDAVDDDADHVHDHHAGGRPDLGPDLDQRDLRARLRAGHLPGTGEDIFRVISIAKDGKSAKVGVVGGAFDSGAAAATLQLELEAHARQHRRREPLRADPEVAVRRPDAAGRRLGDHGDDDQAPTLTVAPPAPTTTATSPIVTDALDTTAPGG